LKYFHVAGALNRRRKGMFSQKPKLDAASFWYTAVVSDYCCRHLTFPHDKLPAIQGLANMMARPDSEYLAGHWMGYRFIESLLWKPEPPARTHDNAADSGTPSWSWASVNGMVKVLQEGSPFEPMVLLASVERSDTRDEIKSLPVVASAGLGMGPSLRISAPMHTLGSSPRDLPHLQIPAKQHEVSITLKTEWLPGVLVGPPNPENERNKTTVDDSQHSSERP
jgi:hypothetical protein